MFTKSKCEDPLARKYEEERESIDKDSWKSAKPSLGNRAENQ